MENKKIIITGSEGFVGKNVCNFLIKRGHDVIKCSRSLGHDLTNETFVKNWFRENKADSLVNLFAINDVLKKEKKSLFDFSLKEFNDYLNVNVVSLFSVCREFAKHNTNSSIVNFSSIYGTSSPYPDLYRNEHKHVGYCVSKSSVIQLTKYLSTHLSPHIRVNCIVFGGIENNHDKEFVERYSNKTPLKRMMKIEELYDIVEFLCTEKSSYCTGAVFTLDGGWGVW